MTLLRLVYRVLFGFIIAQIVAVLIVFPFLLIVAGWLMLTGSAADWLMRPISDSPDISRMVVGIVSLDGGLIVFAVVARVGWELLRGDLECGERSA